MPETPEELYTRAAGALRSPPVHEWETFPFAGEMTPRALEPPTPEEVPRSGAGGVDCHSCRRPDADYLWTDANWRLISLEQPSGLPIVLLLESRRHHAEPGDLSRELACELGVLQARVDRAIMALGGIGRVHICRWGDGAEHLHWWFLGRPRQDAAAAGELCRDLGRRVAADAGGRLAREPRALLGCVRGACMSRALLFDLDDTLTVDVRAAEGAFAQTADLAAERGPGVEAARLARDARSRARELWHRGPGYGYCRGIGMSSWEGLWCRFEGDASPLPELREWAPGYRRETWRLALADQGIDDDPLALECAEAFGRERRARHQVFEDARGTLAELAPRHRLGLVTNGCGCLQREKLAASGLQPFFEVVVVSGELGYGKPDPRVFAHAVAELRSRASDTVMVGDSLARDVEGALAAGLGAVWLNRDGISDLATHAPSISTLAQLPGVLADLGGD